MNAIKVISGILATAMLSGCASSTYLSSRGDGPRLVFNGRSTPDGAYAEVGAEFSTWGDFVALLSPNRWKEPIKSGGSLSWMNPAAWGDDAGRTSRILIGEVVLIGGVAAIVMSGGDDGGDDGGDTGGSSDSGGPTDPGSPPEPPPSDTP